MNKRLLNVLSIFFLIVSASVTARPASICVQDVLDVSIPNEYLRKNEFTVARDLGHYSFHFSIQGQTSFDNFVFKLPAGSVWFDMGAGERRALADGLKINPNIAEGVAVSYVSPKSAIDGREFSGRFQVLDGDYIENMARDKKLDPWKNRVDLISDLYGPLSYSEDIPRLLQIYFDLLKKDGTLVFNLMTERNSKIENGKKRRLLSPILLNAVLENGALNRFGFLAWLQTIPGIEISLSKEQKLSAPYYWKDSIWIGSTWEKSIAIQIRKVDENIIVPKTLSTTSYISGAPPQRFFEIGSKSVPSH